MAEELSHFNARGDAHMVNVSDKPVTHRQAVADGLICMQAATLARIQAGSHHKGDVLGIARVAGIMAAKKTSELIPLCHPLPLASVDIEFTLLDDINAVRCQARVSTDARTGVEMEALTAVQIALLTIYDMCKGLDRGMVMREIALLEKSGGKSGSWRRT